MEYHEINVSYALCSIYEFNSLLEDLIQSINIYIYIYIYILKKETMLIRIKFRYLGILENKKACNQLCRQRDPYLKGNATTFSSTTKGTKTK